MTAKRAKKPKLTFRDEEILRQLVHRAETVVHGPTGKRYQKAGLVKPVHTFTSYALTKAGRAWVEAREKEEIARILGNMKKRDATHAKKRKR